VCTLHAVFLEIVDKKRDIHSLKVKHTNIKAQIPCLCVVCTTAIEQRVRIPAVTMLDYYMSQCNTRNHVELSHS
jgi:hypothetical protein